MRLFSDASLQVDDAYLRRAYLLAERGRGRTSPNPMVGCVIVSDGRIVGEGSHMAAGGPHAEVEALSAAGDRAEGATVYVSLEPCDHEGRTPPCTRSLVCAGVARVVIGMRDPNPDVAGGGAETLRAAGVDVTFADDPTPFVELNEAWVKCVATGRAWLQVKTAVSIDGRPAAVRGERLPLTGPGARALTMRLRSAADAVLVGAATVAADDPVLTVRDVADVPAERQPLRVVLCRRRLPRADAAVFSAEGPALVLAEEAADPLGVSSLRDAGVEVALTPPGSGLAGAMAALGERGVCRVLLEGGPGMFTAGWDAQLVDELVLYHAGGVLGAEAPGLYEGQRALRGAVWEPLMRVVEAGVAGEDAVTVWRPRAGGVVV